VSSRVRTAAAGAAAALVWGAQERFDRRIFGCDYSDVELLGRGSRRRGYAVHAVNGALFGLVYHGLRRRRGVRALPLALAEHLATWPLIGVFADRSLVTSPRAFAQSTWRHALFGALLGRWA
jgi:hypothetical protein